MGLNLHEIDGLKYVGGLEKEYGDNWDKVKDYLTVGAEYPVSEVDDDIVAMIQFGEPTLQIVVREELPNEFGVLKSHIEKGYFTVV